MEHHDYSIQIMTRYAAHGYTLFKAKLPARKVQVESRCQGLGVFTQGLEEVAHLEEKKSIGVRLLDLAILLPHGRTFGKGGGFDHSVVQLLGIVLSLPLAVKLDFIAVLVDIRLTDGIIPNGIGYLVAPIRFNDLETKLIVLIIFFQLVLQVIFIRLKVVI